MGPGLLVVNIIGNCCCTRVLLYAKMLKETENETHKFFVTFLSLVEFLLGWGRAPCLPSAGHTPMIVNSMLFVILIFVCCFGCLPLCASEVESSRTSLASRTSSRTHFEVLGLGLEGQVLGLEASSPRKLACPRLEDSTIFWNVKILWNA